MKNLSRFLTFTTVIGAILAVGFTAYAANPDFFSFLPATVTDGMAAVPWLNWVGSGIVLVSVIAQVILPSDPDKRERS